VLPVEFSDVAPKYFTDGRHRHLVAEADLLRNLEAGQKCFAVRDEFGLVDRTEAGCGMSDLVELVSYHVGLSTHLAEFAKVKTGRRLQWRKLQVLRMTALRQNRTFARCRLLDPWRGLAIAGPIPTRRPVAKC